jgi:hypothetical protein
MSTMEGYGSMGGMSSMSGMSSTGGMSLVGEMEGMGGNVGMGTMGASPVDSCQWFLQCYSCLRPMMASYHLLRFILLMYTQPKFKMKMKNKIWRCKRRW